MARKPSTAQERIERAGKSKTFLGHAKPLEGRIKAVSESVALGIFVRFPLFSKHAQKLIKDALDTAYRIAHNDGAINERRVIEQKLKVVL